MESLIALTGTLTSLAGSEEATLILSSHSLDLNSPSNKLKIRLSLLLGMDVQTHPSSPLVKAVVIYAVQSERNMIIKELPLYCRDLEMVNSFKSRLPLLNETWLVIINPTSGKGKAKRIYEEALKYLLPAGIKVEKIVTRRPMEAHSIVKDSPAEVLSRFDAIVCCSGDGIVHEVINGFFERPDRKELKIKIGGIPAGSASCLVFAALQARGLDFNMDNSLFLLLKGTQKPMKVMHYHIMPYNTHGTIH